MSVSIAATEANNYAALKSLMVAFLADLTAVRNSLSGIKTGTATFDAGSLVDAAGETTTVSVAGSALGDFVMCSHALDVQGITVTGYVSAPGTVSIRFQNESGGTLDLASAAVKVLVFGQSTSAPAALTVTA